MNDEMQVTMGEPVLKESGYYVPLFLNGQPLAHNSYLKINLPTENSAPPTSKKPMDSIHKIALGMIICGIFITIIDETFKNMYLYMYLNTPFHFIYYINIAKLHLALYFLLRSYYNEQTSTKWTTISFIYNVIMLPQVIIAQYIVDTYI